METDYRCAGFRFAGVAAGLKKKDRRDLGLIYCEAPAAVAGVFTRNRVQAAPVLLCRERLVGGVARAVVANSGSANCCTGAQGMRDARAMAAAAAAALGVAEETVFVASTGVIGAPLPMAAIAAATPALAAALHPGGLPDVAAAIMTTDTVPKLAAASVEMPGGGFRLVGVAKGAGMIRPDMATMLSFVCTDLGAHPRLLQQVLAEGAERSFNRITIDGDTSTNDTLLLLASGRSPLRLEDPAVLDRFRERLTALLSDLARQVVRDGEGATKLVEVVVRGAESDRDAQAAAEAVAHSCLVKTALFGQDANWGRILAAAGRSGAALDPLRVDLFFDGVQMVRDGAGCGRQAEERATEVLRRREFTIVLDLKLGVGTARMLTCDLSIDYVKINADYRS